MPISVPKFITRAWASLGSKFDIPENADPLTGKAGYSQGFGPVNLTPVEAGGIPPWGQDMNGILFDLSSAIQYAQAGRHFPFNQDFADAIGGYGNGALVTDPADLSIIYQSTIDSNLVAPPSAGWQRFSVSQATEAIAGIAKVATLEDVDAGVSDQVFITPKKTKPSASGSGVLTGSNNNIALTGIVSLIGLEKGDVIRVVAGSYDKLHTVESLTNSDNVVVNYEHCGSRGNGSLKIPDYTGQVTINRVSKWYNSSEGLGQDWVDVTAFRVPATNYTYSVPRHLKISAASAVSGSGNFIEISQGAVSIGRLSTGASETSTTQTSVSGNATYRGTVGSGSTFLRWKELR